MEQTTIDFDAELKFKNEWVWSLSWTIFNYGAKDNLFNKEACLIALSNTCLPTRLTEIFLDYEKEILTEIHKIQEQQNETHT